jgi:hypothetical protein
MSAEAIVGLFTVGGVVLTLLISLMAGAFVAGKHSNRIQSLEERQKETDIEARQARAEAARTGAQMAGLEAKMGSLKELVSEGFEELRVAIHGLAIRPPGRRNNAPND